MNICYFKLISLCEDIRAGLHDNIILIHDKITYNDQYCIDSGFVNLTKTVKSPCSWEKAFLYIKENSLLHKYDYFWFIEDDVYIPDSKLFEKFHIHTTDLITNSLPLIDIDKKNNWRNWPRIQKDMSYFQKNLTARTFNPLCRLSKRLVHKILEFQEQNKTFVFHEILFPSLCISNNYSTYLFRNLPDYKQYFGCFRHRPIISRHQMVKNVINHPVKDLCDDYSLIDI